MKLALLAMVVSAMLGQPTSAAPPRPEDVSSHVAESRVFVEPSLTDSVGIKNKLNGYLTSGDSIIIAMWPAGAQAPTPTQLSELAQRIDDQTGNKYIIGLSVGDKVVGHSSVLPQGTAADQMMRARNVSTTTVETHFTFITNIHDWLRRNPAVTLPPPDPLPSEDTSPEESIYFPWEGMLGGVLVTGAAMWFFHRRNKIARGKSEEVPFTGIPKDVRELLGRVMELRQRVNDVELQNTIKRMCGDTHQYFQRNTEPEFVKGDAEQFCGHLEGVRQVLERYIDVQGHPRYYSDPEAAMHQGHEAIEGFADFALQSIRRGTSARLVTYTVQTDILSAQREP